MGETEFQTSIQHSLKVRHTPRWLTRKGRDAAHSQEGQWKTARVLLIFMPPRADTRKIARRNQNILMSIDALVSSRLSRASEVDRGISRRAGIFVRCTADAAKAICRIREMPESHNA